VQTDDIVAKSATSGTVYYHRDGLGSTVALSDATGQIVERYRYDVFGRVEIRSATGESVPVSLFGNRFHFTGREWLSEVGLYDYRNRVYSAELGRFLQTDPIRFSAGDGNLYRYVGNNAVNWVDPLGLLWWAALDWGLTVADAKASWDTWNDPCASGWDKGLSIGATIAGAILPGGGVSTGMRAARGLADLPGKGKPGWTKLKGDQGWKDAEGNIWKKDKLHKDHWDVSDKKGNKIREVDYDGNQLWPGGPKNKNK
jgi:RHS repeat-associated protein